ncbi:cobalt-precorrin-6A reductase [Zoogloeaceae bacteirum Par-f-2]|jgi:precorrin-6A/cobalt-precorrin-6A reductase|uniref:cobalt-precorrin-6A reductase n=1 Tax=Pseudothauera hydrothermalis TaxID=2184083 RepID=UPI000C7B1A05|nr:cobalt-precorrin-6A reductase [Pseudothauera hydrothermalis]AUM01233.1 cobalt-precorrin-6A reductase [Rhodocyclaceae bacterium]AVZ80384.1 cobalt-precorrin-6A reductase [Zoogloeaceae bacteirum Par-f-2]
MPKLLLLGGTTEASALASALAARGIDACFSYAGRVKTPRPQPLPTRVGGFGGVEGLARYLVDERITHLIDATHPFAAQISANAVAAARMAGVPLLALSRPPWVPQAGDRWQRVPDIAAALAVLAGPPRRILLALGRLHLAEFATCPQHHYVLRLVDPPAQPIALPDHHVLVDRGPFSVDGDIAVLQHHRIDLVVCKNAGGEGARAKLLAARSLGVPVLMIERPLLPARAEVHTVEAVFDWLAHTPPAG